MIKLDLPPKPDKLTKELQERWTQKFIANPDKSKGWDDIRDNNPWLQEAVLAKSHKKCCYSEMRLKEEGKHMQIDHFHPKTLYPGEVLSWKNLLPSCNICNGKKLNHDTVKEPIVNPFIDNPKDYFYIENSHYWPKEDNKKAQLSIEKLRLNDIEEFVERREYISQQTINTLKVLYVNIVSCTDFSILSISAECLKCLLSTGTRKKEYSALVSTVILSDENFQNIENQLKENNLWDEEFEDLKQELEYCALLKTQI